MICRLPQINNQKGALMVIALLIMVTLAMAGLLVTNDAVMEGRVARNYAINAQSVAAAEGAAKEIMQAIDSIFETSINTSAAIGALDAIFWQPHDDVNTEFDFDPEQWDTYNLKPSDLGDLGFVDSSAAIAVLVKQPDMTVDTGLGTAWAKSIYEYDIYCRAVHAGVGNNESMLVIGFRTDK